VSRVDLDSPEHAVCSAALRTAKEDFYSSNRALHAAWAERDKLRAENERLRAGVRKLIDDNWGMVSHGDLLNELEAILAGQSESDDKDGG
jgi:hypothetical protein